MQQRLENAILDALPRELVESNFANVLGDPRTKLPGSHAQTLVTIDTNQMKKEMLPIHQIINHSNMVCSVGRCSHKIELR